MYSRDELLEQMGPEVTQHVAERIRRFAYLPPKQIDKLSAEALNENWGNDMFVLLKYLSVQVGWAIAQGRFTEGEDQLYMAAGHLQTRYGTPFVPCLSEE